MNILVTGGLGFIWSNFIRHLLSNNPDYKIVNLDAVTYAGNKDNLKDLEGNKNYTFVKGNICNKDDVGKAIKDIDEIVNFAAETHVDRSIISAEPFIMTDVFGTYVLLEAVSKYEIPKFIHISTDEVYGSIEKGSFKETDRLNPASPYSASKASADMICNSYFVTYNLPVIIVRSTNNYGPYQNPEKFLQKMVTNAIMGKPMPIYGDGLNVRDWLYVIDNCTAIEIAMNKGKFGEIYNVSSDTEMPNIEVAKLVLKHLGKPESLINFVTDRPGHDRRYSLDSSKIRQLGWTPKTSFEIGLRNTIEWYLNNKQWWTPLIS